MYSSNNHDDVTKWKHFPRYWPFVRGIHRSPVTSPHEGEWHGALVFCLIYIWTNGWANTRDAADLRRHRTHYDVNLMCIPTITVTVSVSHWGRVTHLCASKLTVIVSDNGLSPGRRQAIIWTNAGISLIWTLGTNLKEILSEIHTFAFKKMHYKMSSVKCRSFCLGLNVLNYLLWFDVLLIDM